MPAVNDIMQFRILARFCGEPIVTTFGMSVTNAAASWTEQAQQGYTDMASAVGLGLPGGLWVLGLSVQYVLQEMQVVDVYPGTNAMWSSTTSGVGTVDDEDAMPPNDCLAVTWRSDFKGPGSRGRNYLVGFAEGSANGGYWEAGAQDYASNVVAGLLGVFGETGTGSTRLCIIHKTSNGGVRGAPVVPLVPPEIKPVMSYTVHNEVRSLGRRAVGRHIHRARSLV